MAAVVPLSVSVCVPTYEPDVDLLVETLASVFAQRTGDLRLELVVLDDASPSGSEPGGVDLGAVVADARGRAASAPGADARAVTVVAEVGERNVGMVGNWNRAVVRSSGDLAMVLSQDDVLEPDALCRLAAPLGADPACTVVAGGRVRIDAAGRPLHDRTMVNDREHIWLRRDRYDLDGAEMAALCLRNGLAYGEPSAVLFRRSSFDAVGGYDPSFEHAADVDFTMRLAALGSAVYLRPPVLRRRFHDTNLTWSHIRNGATLRDRERLHAAFRGSVTARARSRADVTMVSRGTRDALRALRWRDTALARANLRSVRRHVRASPRHYVEHLVEVARHRNADAR